jgi:PAS domain-containing protein
MPQNEIEIILARQLASYLATPMFIVDPQGDLLYYNEPAEKLLGHRFEQTGAMSAAEWTTLFDPTDDAGLPFPAESLPLVIAFVERRPAQHRFWIQGLDNARRCIEVVAFPLVGQQDRFLGAAAIFWEVKEG